MIFDCISSQFLQQLEEKIKFKIHPIIFLANSGNSPFYLDFEIHENPVAMYKTSLSLSILWCIRNSPKRISRIQFLCRTDSMMNGEWTENSEKCWKCVFNGLWIATGHLRAVSRTLFGKNHFNQARQNGWITVQGTITMHSVSYDMHPEIVSLQLSIPIFRVFILENEYVLYGLFPP